MATGDIENLKMKLTIVSAVKPEKKKYYRVLAPETDKKITCWSDRITEYVGKTQEFDVEKKEMSGDNGPWTSYTIKLPGETGGGGGFQKSGKSWGGGGKSATEIVTSAKTMTLSFAKDLTEKYMETCGKSLTWPEVLETWKSGYKLTIPLLELDKIQEAPKPAPQEATGGVSKPVETLIKEIQATTSKQEAAGWWNTNNGFIKALSPEDRQKLFKAKNEHLEMIEYNQSPMPDEGEIPF